MIAIKRIYKVSAGDTLWGIAKKYLGRVSRYTEIVRLNGLKTAYLSEGQLLVLPMAQEALMNNQKKARIAFAQAIIQSMWVKGLITTAERNKIALKTEEKLQKNNC